MIEVGRVCVKIAGRDAGKKCVVVSVLDKSFVLIDGETRRRKCNSLHLEPLAQTLDIKANAAHAQIVSAFNSLGIELKETKAKKAAQRPRVMRRSKLAKPASTKAESSKAKPAKSTKKAQEKTVEAVVVKEEKTEQKPKVSKKTNLKAEKKE